MYCKHKGSKYDYEDDSVFVDDFGNEGYDGSECVTFDDGYQLFVDGLLMSAMDFIREYGSHMNLNVDRARHNSWRDVAGRLIKKGDKYWTFFDDEYAYKTLEDTDFRFFCTELADISLGEFWEYEYWADVEEVRADMAYCEWRDSRYED